MKQSPKHLASASLYRPADCEIIAVCDLTPHEKLFRLRLADGKPLGHLPGHFVQVSLLGWGEAPISVASSPTRSGYFEMGVRRAGTLTGALHEMKAGDVIGIRGPFGKPFDLPRLRGKDLLLVSGGCGLAPMRSLIQYCEDQPREFGSITILYGAKSPADTLFKDDLAAWEASARFTCSRTVDRITGGDCYSGGVGLVTALIPPLEIDPGRTVAVLVGPPVMYRAVVEELRKKGLGTDRIVVSLERQMRCGVGKCGHCAIEHLYCCQDGPVFWLNEIENLKGAL
ncbi:FAD/NAD(P)-binding protein [Geobacter benzoatilyticus]|uniref:FAD/NAD(P)-binding protein n=1 Tax=Geobacter benzoatilyticus TaxID=2815309 RepID=A0ABX7PZH7_9BACT|nr:FAD/NAD(P)-binding protein [Geobacter benzoatilyticus]QSV44548.1 FAD/NAD(P)-binding protein [Geobacter benzoatilyticus]